MRTALAASLAGLALAACATSGKPGPAAPVEVKATGTRGEASATRVQRASATVRSVDRAARTVTIEDESGATETVKLGPQAARLDEIQPGDVIRVELEQALLLQYQHPGSEAVEPKVVVAGERAGAGAAPGAAAAAGLQSTVTVTAVDPPGRLVSFQGPGGRTFQVKAGPDLAIEKLKVGDRLLATYLETTAVAVEKPKR